MTELTGKPLETVLADWSEDAQVLRRRGHGKDAELIEQLVADVRGAVEDWVTWLSEPDAKLRSGESDAWFRRNRSRLVELGMAEKREKSWYYRRCCIRQRKHLSSVREDAKRAAQSAA